MKQTAQAAADAAPKQPYRVLVHLQKDGKYFEPSAVKLVTIELTDEEAKPLLAANAIAPVPPIP